MNYLGYDVGGSSVKYAVVDDQGNFLAQGKFATPPTREKFYTELKAVKERMAADYALTGIGFSLPGAVDAESGIIGGSSMVPYIHDFPIRAALERQLGLPVAMENDANCAALGEVWRGAAKHYQDVVFLVIGSGVGGAIIKNRRIHHGRHLHGGEFGYMVVDDQYRILSEAAATGWMAKRVAKAKGLPEDQMDGEKAFALMEQGDADASREIESMFEYLARGIYNIQYTYDPELFVIGGAVSARPDFAEQLDRHIQKILDAVKIARVRPQVACCRFGNAANILGAVYNFQQSC